MIAKHTGSMEEREGWGPRTLSVILGCSVQVEFRKKDDLVQEGYITFFHSS